MPTLADFHKRNEKSTNRFVLISFTICLISVSVANVMIDLGILISSCVVSFLFCSSYVIWVMRKTDINLEVLKSIVYRYLILIVLIISALIGSFYFDWSF